MSHATLQDRTLRKGGFITTYTGRRVYLADPRPQDVNIEDIAHALSNLCRWVGHARRFYSVAEHSVLVSNHFHHAGDALWGLLHDAPETYLGDCTRPLKKMLPDYKRLEDAWMSVIRDALSLPHTEPAMLKTVDGWLLNDEARALMDESCPEFSREGGTSARIECWTPEVAEGRFLACYHGLRKALAA